MNAETMPALSLWQPWASLWVCPAKLHETRHWPIKHRGWLLVHAAKRKIDDEAAEELDDLMDAYYSQHWGLEIPFGALLGMVNILDCVPSEKLMVQAGFTETENYRCGNFEPGRFGFRRGEFKRFARPIPYRGAQGIFRVPRSIFEGQPFEALFADDDALMRAQMAA